MLVVDYRGRRGDASSVPPVHTAKPPPVVGQMGAQLRQAAGVNPEPFILRKCIFKNEDFGYRRITAERPLRDTKGKVLLGEKGRLKGKRHPDSALLGSEETHGGDV